GIVSLETDASAIDDPYLRKALSLAVDGTDLQELRKMMEIDIALAEHTAESDAKVWEAAGGYAPTIGIIGAVMGLIQVMKHLEDIKEVGHGIAVAFVATVYGVASANILFLPAAAKLRMRINEATLRKDMILEGIIGIVEGLNPTLIRLKLDAYNPIREVKKASTPKPAAVPAPGRSARRFPTKLRPGREAIPSFEEQAMTRKKHAAHANHERWLVSYADFMTLLFAFFVVMFASTQNNKNQAKDVSDSVRQALEHGQFSAALSTVLGRGRHEAKKAPLSKDATPERENPNAPPPTRPTAHPPDLAQSLDTLQ